MPMAVGSQVRRVLRAMFGAYRRVPVRWRLGGGSAALTFVILAGVAGVTDVLTDRHVSNAFYAQQSGAALQYAGEIGPTRVGNVVNCTQAITQFGLDTGAQTRLFTRDGTLLCSSQPNSTYTAPGLKVPAFRAPRFVNDGYVEAATTSTPG